MPGLSYTRFENRWRIAGRLVTLTPLHIGDGLSAEDRIERVDGEAREVQTICRDHGGNPFIPASAIKGPLRAWLVKTRHFQNSWVQLFGTEDADDPDACGGKVGFWDAHLDAASPAPAFVAGAEPPFWELGKRTAVAVSVSLDRRTRTALERALFHYEYVPAGTAFAVELTAQNVTREEVAHLLGLLAQFNDKAEPITLGAHSVHGWGQVEWQYGKVFCVDREDVAAWLDNRTVRTAGFGVATKEVGVAPEPVTKASGRLLIFEVNLDFHSPLLVPDPSRRKKKTTGLEEDRSDGPPDAQPLVDLDGRPMIPARGVRGVLRSRAEMILRTLGHDIPAAHEAGPVRSKPDLERLDRVSRVFGAPGWRAPLEISDFTLGPLTDLARRRQEFVAIDRFTGGASSGKKFNCNAFIGVKLAGKLTLNFERLGRAKADAYGPALLALLLRDLEEGDLTFGSGAAKGYGACRAVISVRNGPVAQAFASWCADPVTQESLEALRDLGNRASNNVRIH